MLLGAGLFIIALASFLGHEAVSPFVETTFTLLGSGLLITGHWRNVLETLFSRLFPERTADLAGRNKAISGLLNIINC